MRKIHGFSIAEMLVVLLLMSVAIAVSMPVFTVKKSTSVSSTSIVPVGAILTYAKASPPSGYLECNGQAVSRTGYSALFNVIGTTYGAGDGSSTFNLPDLRGEFVRGWSNGRAGVDAGRAFGSSQADELKSHTHTYTTFSSTGTGSAGGSLWSGTTTQDSSATGGTETRPRNIALMYIIRAQ